MPITPPKTTPADRRVLGVALSIGVAGILMTAVPAIDFRIKRAFAERLSRHAEIAAPAMARIEVRELARRGVVAIPELVRLAGSAHPEAADAARDALSAILSSWESEYRTSQNASRLAEKLTILAKALEHWTPEYEIVSRLWADRLALQIADDCAVVSASEAATLLGSCDRILAMATPAARPGPTPPHDARSTDAFVAKSQDPALLIGESADATPQYSPPAADGFPAAQSIAAPQIKPVVTPPGEGDLRLVDEPLVAPVIDAPPPYAPAAIPTPEPREPRIANAVDDVRPRPLPAPKPEVVDVPTPQQVRLMLRKYRQMSDAELARSLAMSTSFESRTIQQVLRERNLPTAIGPKASVARNVSSDVERRILDQVSRLTPARGRQLLRDLVADADEDPEVRLQALALLATSGDPMLTAIARERAISDADPRVAELATRIVREQDGAKK